MVDSLTVVALPELSIFRERVFPAATDAVPVKLLSRRLEGGVVPLVFVSDELSKVSSFSKSRLARRLIGVKPPKSASGEKCTRLLKRLP